MATSTIPERLSQAQEWVVFGHALFDRTGRLEAVAPTQWVVFSLFSPQTISFFMEEINIPKNAVIALTVYTAVSL